MAELGQQSSARRVGNLERVGVYVSMAILSMWQNHPRAKIIMGMARASVLGKGPDGYDEELLEQLGALISEAMDYYEKGEFPPAMARMRVAHDLVGLHVIRISGE